MSHHIFPSGGREAFLRKPRQYSPALLKPLDKVSTINSGWNDPVLLALPSTPPDPRHEPEWDSPTVNVLPNADSRRGGFSPRPFGSTARPQLPAQLPSLPRTPLQSMATRNEHWYSDPIHGLFTNCVPEAVSSRWTTSNRNVFRPRPGVPDASVSSRVMERLANASNGTVSSSLTAKPIVRAALQWPAPRPVRPMRARVLTCAVAASRTHMSAPAHDVVASCSPGTRRRNGSSSLSPPLFFRRAWALGSVCAAFPEPALLGAPEWPGLALLTRMKVLVCG